MLNQSLKTELSHLSLQDKLEVFECIREDIEPPSDQRFSELTPTQHAELLRRAKQAQAEPGAGRSWEDVKRRILGG